MTIKDKIIHMIEFSGKRSDWDGWSKRFLVQAKHKGYKKLLLGKRDQVRVNEITIQDECDLTVAGNSGQDKPL